MRKKKYMLLVADLSAEEAWALITDGASGLLHQHYFLNATWQTL